MKIYFKYLLQYIKNMYWNWTLIPLGILFFCNTTLSLLIAIIIITMGLTSCCIFSYMRYLLETDEE